MTINIFFSKIANKTIVMEFELSDTIKTLKDRFFNLCIDRYNTDYSDILRLTFAGKLLYNNDATLDELNITDGSTIYMFVVSNRSKCHICG